MIEPRREVLEIKPGTWITRATLGDLAGFVHFLTMVTFAIGITLNWRRSSHSPQGSNRT